MSLKGEFGAFEKRIECPLRDQLADFLVREMKVDPDAATRYANNFMRCYLERADRVLMDRVEYKADRRRRRTWR